MTDPQDPQSAGYPGDSANEGADSVSDITPLDPQTEEILLGALATLPALKMPQAQAQQSPRYRRSANIRAVGSWESLESQRQASGHWSWEPRCSMVNRTQIRRWPPSPSR